MPRLLPDARAATRLARARAPLRLGLAGGGTDLPAYAGRFGGAVLNATIDRYAFASVAARTDGLLVFDAGDLDRLETLIPAARLQASGLSLHRGVYERMMRDFNDARPLALTVATAVDAPLGSGLGSSSALVVALIQAYAAFLGRTLPPGETARLACAIERSDLGLAGGQQDQYAAAYGGLNMIRFPTRGDAIVDRLRVPPVVLRELEASLVICFSGQARESGRIIAEQAGNVAADEAALAAMHRLKDGVLAMRDALLDGNLIAFAAGLDQSWQAKKATASGIVTLATEALEALARAAGASAVKISGAGGGGFMMCVVQPERRARLIAALLAAGRPTYPVRLTEAGAEAWTPHRPAQIFPGPADEPAIAPAALSRPPHPVSAQQGREAARV